MSRPKIGSLCSGYEGLGMGVQRAIGGELVWVSDIDPGANKILAHHYPDLPNLGDFTKTDWSTVEPVDVLTAGFPCQPVSHAGKRLGDNDERWLWDDVARAVGALRPGLVVLENVRGLLSAGGGRLFGRVLGALAELGYDAQWHGLRAADVGAPHGRWRVFIVAHPASGRRRERWAEPARVVRGLDAPERRGAALLPTPRSSDCNGAGAHGEGGVDLRTAVSLLPTPTCEPDTGNGHARNLGKEARLLPTPAVNDMGEGKTPDAWDEWTAKMQAAHGNGNGHGKSLAIEAQRLPPTPRALDATGVCGVTPNRSDEANARAGETLTDVGRENRWGDYAPAIARWEAVLGRPAPAPTEPGPKGSPRLSPKFVEWMMALPDGWVTDVPGLTRNAQLKALGNGVVWVQAEAALRLMLGAEVAA